MMLFDEYSLNKPKYCYLIKDLLTNNNYKLYSAPSLEDIFKDSEILEYKNTFLSEYSVLTNELWQKLLIKFIDGQYYFKSDIEKEEDNKVFLEFLLHCLFKMDELATQYFATISRIESKDGNFITTSETTTENYDIPTFTQDGEQSEGNIGNKSTITTQGRENILNLERQYFVEIAKLKNQFLDEITSDINYFCKENKIELLGKI